MFDKIIKKLLDYYLHDYIEDFDKHLSKIKIRKGEIELVDLQLNTKFFESIYLPVELIHGRIGRMLIYIPSYIHWQKHKVKV